VKGWKQRWFVLHGSSLYYYTKSSSYAPKGVLELQTLELIETPDKIDKNFAFGLKDATTLHFLSASNEGEKQEWIESIKANKEKEALPPPENSSIKKKKGVKYAFETNLASSILGRRLIKDAVPGEAWQILDNVSSFIGKVKGEETGKAFKKDFLKIGSKLGLLHYNKIVGDEVVKRWRKVFLKLASVVVDFYQMPSIFDCQIILKILTDLKKDADEILVPKLSTRSIEKLNFVFNVITDEALIANFFQKKKWKELENIATIIRSTVSNLREPM